MENDKLFKIAFDFLSKEHFYGLYLAYDIGDRLVFFGGNPSEPYYGCRSVSVDKKNGNCEWFIVETDKENEKMLDEAAEIEIPIKYAYKSEEEILIL